MSDAVNQPEHYKQGKVEIIDAITSVVAGYDAIAAYCLGNVIKYIARAPFKDNTVEDLRKARRYFDRALEEMGVGVWQPAETLSEDTPEVLVCMHYGDAPYRMSFVDGTWRIHDEHGPEYKHTTEQMRANWHYWMPAPRPPEEDGR